MSQLNHARFSGHWYSDDPRTLTADLEDHIRRSASIEPPESRDGRPDSAPGRPGNTPEQIAGTVDGPTDLICGAVLPHAGLSFSGRGIAHAFRTFPEGGIDRVLILSPSHYAPLNPRSLFVESFDHHETPLGNLSGAPDFAPTLRGSLGSEVVNAEAAIEREHGTEMFLPYLYHVAPEAIVSLVLVPEVEGEERLHRWAAAIRSSLAGEPVGSGAALVIMSSDFTHYGRRFGYTPYGVSDPDLVADAVRTDDLAVATAVAAGNASVLRERMERPITICGRYPILLGLAILNGTGTATGSGTATVSRRGIVADYYTSREVNRSDGIDFVCYASILFQGRDKSRKGGTR